MIIEPIPTNPRTPVRRAIRVVGIVLPVLLLVGVVAAGSLGPRPDPREPDPSRLADPSARPTAVSDGAIDPGGLGVGVPTVTADLRVLAISAAQPLLASGATRPLAVAGTLRDVVPVTVCSAADGDTRGSLGPLCERTGLLDAAGGDRAPHLHVRIPAGVRLPEAFERPGSPGVAPVVLVGHGDGADAPCVLSARGCGERFTVDRVAWADGGPWDPGPVFDAGLEVAPPSIALRGLDAAETLATGWSGTILVAALIRPSTLALVDPIAAQDVPAGPAPEDLVWYVRGLDTSYDPDRYPLDHAPPRVSWVVTDYATGLVLSRGPVAAPGELPGAIAGLRVRTIADATAAWRANPSPKVVAVSGYLRAWVDPQTCTDPIAGLPGLGCERQAILASAPWVDAGGPIAEVAIGPHVAGLVPPGVTVPDSAIGLPVVRLREPPQVVVIARFGASDDGCAADLTGCHQPFTIEAVAWAGGQPIAPGRQLASGIDANVAALTSSGSNVLDTSTRLLRVVLIHASDLLQVDAVAADALRLAIDPDATRPVWYVRGYDARTGLISYFVVDATTGRLLVWSGGT